MKTILIPIFQGVEAKNILRTDIFSYLSERKDIKKVFLVPNSQKKEYFEKEFKGENIIFAVYDHYEIGRSDRIMQFFKSNLLNTSTMDIRRKSFFGKNHNYLLFILKWAFCKSFSNKFFRSIVRWTDLNLLKEHRFDEIFRVYSPDIVFVAHPFSDIEASIIKTARKNNIFTVALINSWDKITSRNMVRILPDKVLVHNMIIKKEAIDHMDMGPDDIEVVGIPQYDIYFQALKNKEQQTTKDIFCLKMNLDPAKKIILFCPVGSQYSKADGEMLGLLDNFINNGKINFPSQIIVRYPPNDTINFDQNKYRHCVFYRPGVRFTQKRGLDWDMSFKDIELLKDTLFFSDILIAAASSMSVDASVFDVPVINILLKDIEDNSWFYQTEHYKKLLSCGGIKMAYDKKELLDQINRYLAYPEEDNQGRKKIVQRQCWKDDGRAGERIAKFIIKNLGL